MDLVYHGLCDTSCGAMAGTGLDKVCSPFIRYSRHNSHAEVSLSFV